MRARLYVWSTKLELKLYFLPGYAPDINPDDLVWNIVKRTGVARRPLQKERNWNRRFMSNSNKMNYPAASGGEFDPKRLKPACIGSWTSPSVKTTAGFAKTKPRRTSRTCASSPWRFYAMRPLTPNAACADEGKPLTVSPIIALRYLDGSRIVEGDRSVRTTIRKQHQSP
jgi:hypothetical protein